MHSLNLTQETMKLLMQVKRVLKSEYDISVHLESEDLASQLTKAIAENHNESLYSLACELWDELSKANPNHATQVELLHQRHHLDDAWEHQLETVH